MTSCLARFDVHASTSASTSALCCQRASAVS